MNPLAVGVLAYILLGLELALRPALALGPESGAGRIVPSLVLPLVIFIAMSAPVPAALWTALFIGAATDLTTRLQRVNAEPPLLTLIGPHAIGFLAAAYLAVQLRGLMIRRNPLALVALTALGGALAALMAVAIITLRAQFDDALAWAGGRELLTRLGSALYSGVVALPMAFMLRPLAGLLGLPETTGRRYAR